MKSRAILRLLRLGGRATDLRLGPDQVAYADARTSCDDARIALSLACGAPIGEIHPSNGTWDTPVPA